MMQKTRNSSENVIWSDWKSVRVYAKDRESLKIRLEAEASSQGAAEPSAARFDGDVGLQ